MFLLGKITYFETTNYTYSIAITLKQSNIWVRTFEHLGTTFEQMGTFEIPLRPVIT